MRNLFDHLGKTIGLSALSPCGLTVLEDVIAPDARRADIRHEPDAARASARARLGLLGRIASTFCLIELYSGAPDEDDALACLGKLIACRQGQQREALKKRKEREKLEEASPPQALVSPFGWIIAARRPASVLAGLAATPAAGWPRGVYFSTGGMLRMGVVVASELPRERETLLVRLMAAGPLLRDAMVDLAALEVGALERAVAEQILLDLEHGLGKKSCPTPDEEEFIVSMQGTWSDARRIGRDEGRAEGEASALLTVLRSRGVAVTDSARERIVAERDPARIERWIEKAAVAASLADVLDDPS